MKAAGGCLCGRLRYQIDGEPVYQYNCHCRDCQRMSGAGFLPLMALPDRCVSHLGEVTWYARRADSGREAIEGFCPRCGSRVFGAGDSLPGLMLVCAGTLDDPALFAPTADIYTRSAPHWDRMDPVLAKWATDPDA
jgi:hypothetical protein